MNPDPIAKWLREQSRRNALDAWPDVVAKAIIADPNEFAEALKKAGFTRDPTFHPGSPPEPPHVHEWSSGVHSGRATWRCLCGASATTYAPVPTAPIAIETELGEEWFIHGHHSDTAARTAVMRTAVRSGYGDEWNPADVLTVTRGWWREDANPDNDEWWVKCDESDDDAEAFTLVKL